MTIQLDPRTKLPIWPGGVVPEQPRDAHGSPILPKPVWTPPPMDPVPLTPPPPILPDVVQILTERINGLEGRILALETRG